MLREKINFWTKKSDETPSAEMAVVPYDDTDMYSDNNYKTFDSIASDAITDQIPDSEKQEAISQAFELYLATKANVAPVIAGFADDLLKNADGRQIIFAARDGLGAYEAAKVLSKRFPSEYSVQDEDLLFAYLTRKIVGGTDPATLVAYLEQEGVRDVEDPVVIADIGMYGTIMYSMRDVLPQAEARYLISRNHTIPGYADDGGGRQLKSFRSIVGNSAVHFMEDTFSGLTDSPSRLDDKDGTLVPNYSENAFEPKELLKRKYAIQAIIDYVKTVDHTPTADEQQAAISKLDTFLEDREHYAHLMVPRIR